MPYDSKKKSHDSKKKSHDSKKKSHVSKKKSHVSKKTSHVSEKISDVSEKESDTPKRHSTFRNVLRHGFPHNWHFFALQGEISLLNHIFFTIPTKSTRFFKGSRRYFGK